VAGPAAGGAGELAEAEAAEQGEHGLLLGPGVVEQPVHPGQAQPVRRLADQPGGHAAAAVGLVDVEVADVGPAGEVGQAPALGQVGVDLDVADDLVVDDPGQPGAVDPKGPAQPQPTDGRLGRPGQLLDHGQQHDLGVAVVLGPGPLLVDEPRPLVQRAHVRPLLGHAVHARGGQGPVGVPVGHPPGPEPVQAGVHQGGGRVGPEARLRPEQQPVDLGAAAIALADLLTGAVAQQVGGGHHPAALLGHQGDPLGHPRVDDELARVALQLAQDGVDRHHHAWHDGLNVGVDQGGQLLAVGAAERAHLDCGHGRPPTRRRRSARALPGGRYRCGTPPTVPGRARPGQAPR
jgi:hypothetical protein